MKKIEKLLNNVKESNLSDKDKMTIKFITSSLKVILFPSEVSKVQMLPEGFDASEEFKNNLKLLYENEADGE